MLIFHPVVEGLPAISPMARAELEADILAHGQQIPIPLVDGMIWDGRARFDICIENGIAPWLVPLRGGSATQTWIDLNYSRAGTPNSPERSAIVAALSKVDDIDVRAKVEGDRRNWLANARNEFQRVHRRKPTPCVVCGAAAGFSHWHHLFPLHLQYECGAMDAQHDAECLCPIHHKEVHKLLSGHLLGATDLSYLDDIPDRDIPRWSKVVEVAQRGADLCYAALGKTADDATSRRYDPPYARFILGQAQSCYPWPRTT